MKINDPDAFTEFVWGYIDAAIWTEQEPLGFDFGSGPADNAVIEHRDELSPAAHATMRAACADFLAGLEPGSLDEWYPDQAGHDFWLTRNGHGAGFWDRGRERGDYLTEQCRPYGEQRLWRPERDANDDEIEANMRGDVVPGWAEFDSPLLAPTVPDTDKPIEVE